MRRSPYFSLLLAALALLIIALVVVRSDGMSEYEDESLWYRFAIGVIYAVLAIGPAFIAEILMRALLPAALAARERRRRKVALSGASKQKRLAEEKIREITDEYEAYRYWVTRITGRYNKIWNQARARCGHTEPASSPNSPPT